MALNRKRKWLLGLGIPLGLLVLLALLFRWDWLIPLIEPRASAALGRPVTLEHLHVKLGRTVVVTADNVVVGNPEGFDDPVPLARATYQDYDPALPTTTDGVVAGLLGFLAAWGGWRVLSDVGRRVVRRRPRTEVTTA